MKAVMYGAGNIGRGFIGALFSQSGYEVTFVDVSEPVVAALCDNQKYPIRYVSNKGHEDIWIENVTAVNGNDEEATSNAIANCDIMATAVGARSLKHIVPNIVSGLRKRWLMKKEPLNIIICENLMHANKILEDILKACLSDEECIKLDETVGLVEASVGRMVPIQTEEMKDGEPLRICAERYGFLPVDKDAFRGRIPDITNLVPVAPFDFYIKRKLYVHNMGHAVCSFLGGFNGRKFIWQAIDDPDILHIVQNAMIESAVALSKKYHENLDEILPHIIDLLVRFQNQALGDTCKRVGGDPDRKLGREDRLIGASMLCIEQGISPVYTALGAAGAIYRYLSENNMEQTLEGASDVLRTVSMLEPEHPLAALILTMYHSFLSGDAPVTMRRLADTQKAATLQNIV